MVTKDEIYEMSKIAKISVTEQELAEFTDDINDILRFVDTKNESVHTDDEFCSLHDMENVFREDEEEESLNALDVLRNADGGENMFFSIKTAT